MSKELAALNGKLSNQSYVSGCVPSKDDASAFKEMFGNNTAVMQWAARMASYYQSERDEIAKTAPAKKQAEPKKADKKADKKAEKKHADPAAAPAAKKQEIPDGPVTAAPLITNFKKFAGDKSAYFMNINLEYTNDTMAYLAGPEGFEPREILTMLTDSKNCEKYVATYIKVAKTKESKQDKVKEEITKLVEDFMSPKVGGCKKLQEEAEKKAVEVDPETAELIADFEKFLTEKELKNVTLPKFKAVLEYLPEGFHKADIKSMLTVGDDCDELLESYVRINAVPGTEKLRVRTEIVNLVEAFAESKGIVQEEAFSF